LFQICAHSQVQSISCNVVRPTNLSSTHNPTLSRRSQLQSLHTDFIFAKKFSHSDSESTNAATYKHSCRWSWRVCWALRSSLFFNYLSSTLLWVLSRQ
jgi:hypothetical protein